MAKVRYSAGLKVTAVVAQQIFSVVLVLCIIVLVVLFQKDILDFGNMKDKSFESSGYFSAKFQEAADEILNFIDLRKKFETDGSYDSEKEIDIWGYRHNQEVAAGSAGGRDEAPIIYTLGNLSEWSRSYSKANYEFVSSLSLDHGIQQKRDIYRNGNSVLSEEKSISSLDEMTAELQEIIVENVEHYYGGSYSISGKNWGTDSANLQADTGNYGAEGQERTTANQLRLAAISQKDASNIMPEEEGISREEASAALAEEEETGQEDADEAAAEDGTVSQRNVGTVMAEETGQEDADEAASEEEKSSGEDSGEASLSIKAIVKKVINGKLYGLKEEELALLLRSMDLAEADTSVVYDFIDEDYFPIGGMGIWNGFMTGKYSMEQMQNAYAALEYTLANIGAEINQYKRCLNLYNLTEQGTNVYYWIGRGDEEAVYTNIKEPVDVPFEKFGEKKGKYLFYQEREIRLETNVKDMEDVFYNRLEPRYGGKGSVFFICVDTGFPNEDGFLQAKREYAKMRPWIFLSITGLAISFSICLVCLIYLSMAAGRREGEDQVYLNLFDRLPTEFLYLFAVAEVIFCFLMIGEVFYRFGSEELAGLLIMSGVLAFFCMAFLSIFYLSFVRRIRAGVLWSQSILHWFVKGIGMLFTHRKSSTKMLIWFGIHLAACFMLLSRMLSNYYSGGQLILGTVCFVLLCGIEAVLIIREGVQRNKVLEGIGKISSGDLEYKIAVEELNGDNRRLAEAVNTIGDGLFHAVDDSMRNEHLKADLITNVSHDIKTPLTSIINYVDLLKREELPNERIQGYIAVLDAKSQRLKQLTEDLVEASKVSSGNIKLEMERINLVELVYQTGGEFNEKFEARSLTVVTKLPREPVVILADGRRIWRVLENLYNNVAKYAMEHTRVYVDLEADGEQVCFSIKNISENPLNIQADELTERFIRGDISRSTEGSGLGLSIAKSLTALMGGEFEIYLDGDLFKAMVKFQQQPEQRMIGAGEDDWQE